MNILLTGGTGFIGSHFIQQALSANHSVFALRRSNLSQPRIDLKEQPYWIHSDLITFQFDLLPEIDCLVHLAAHTGNVPYDSLGNCLHWNLVASLRLFEKARIAGISNFLVAGSCFEYGLSGERFSEIPTDAPLEPTNSYAASKAAATIALRQWANQFNIHLQILRIFHVYGHGELNTRFWPSLRKAAANGSDFSMTLGEQVRDFQPVERVAGAFISNLSSSLHTSPCNSIRNLSTGNFMTLRDFATSEWNSLNARGTIKFGQFNYRPGEVMRYVPGQNLTII